MNPKKFAIDIAKQAGNIIQENFTLGMKKEWKKDKTPLTETDQIINDMVVKGIKENFPDHGILAEEGGNTQEQAEYVWLCDPVDGTIPFSYGIPTCVFSITLVKSGDPILGVVLDPFQDRLYYAEKGKGAFLNDKQIHVSEEKSIDRNLVCAVAWQTAPYDLLSLPEKLVKKGAIIVNLGSTIYMGMLVACGESVATAWPGKTPWDMAPLKIIVEEAGGKVTDLNGNDQKYNKDIFGTVASNGYVHDQIIAMTKQSSSK